MQETVGDALLEELRIPAGIVTADLDNEREVVLRRGLVWLAVLASISIPGVYPPVRVGPHRLVDGGVVNPVPNDVAADLGADVVIAVRLVTPAAERDPSGEAVPGSGGGGPSALSTIIRSIEMMQSAMGPRQTEVPTIAVTPRLVDLPAGGLRRFAEGRRLVEAGEEAAEAALPRLAAAVPWLGR